MKYSEVGYGNPSFMSVEMENETRIVGFCLERIVSMYVRVWVGNRVLIVDSVEGFKMGLKDKKCFKLVFGVRNGEK